MHELIVTLDELARRPRPRSEVGGKARYLARLYAAGLPVPQGVVVTAAAQALAPDEQACLFSELVALARTLGPWLAVRSSAVMEDSVAGAAPGVFASECHVAPDQVEAAVRAVWASAEARLVRAYAAARGVDEVPMAVIVQRQVPDTADPAMAGAMYTRLPGHEHSDDMLIETRSGVASVPGEQAPASLRVPRPAAEDSGAQDKVAEGTAAEDTGAVDAGAEDMKALDRRTLAALCALGLQAESAIAADAGADVEWVAAGDRVWVVQARPIVHPPERPDFPVALLRFSRSEPHTIWRLDVTHNPEPMSLAQIGLVERVDGAGLAPYRMRVVGGYLYVAGGESAKVEPDAQQDLTAAVLRRRFATELRPAMEAALAPGRADDADLATAVAAYERFYTVYAGDLTPLLSRARRVLPEFLQEHIGGDESERLAGELLADGSPARLESLIDQAARGDIEFAELVSEAGDLAPAWDVACTTFVEMPDILQRAVAYARENRTNQADAFRTVHERIESVRAQLDSHARTRFDECLDLARAARDIGELDDRLYARAQAAVRRALLRHARRWHLHSEDDIFHLPLSQVMASVEHGHVLDPVRVRRMAQAARTARQRQRMWHMPLAFANGRPVEERPALGRGMWQGRGIGGQVRGTAVRIHDMSEMPQLAPGSRDSIIVAPTLTPAMAFALQGATAIVVEHGGLLDHGAAMARELGIPCVVACAGAWTEIRTGDALWLDGDAGLVIRATGPLPAAP